jgi:hypothetical protein
LKTGSLKRGDHNYYKVSSGAKDRERDRWQDRGNDFPMPQTSSSAKYSEISTEERKKTIPTEFLENRLVDRKQDTEDTGPAREYNTQIGPADQASYSGQIDRPIWQDTEY